MSGTSYDAIEVAAASFRLRGSELRMRPLGALTVGYTDRLREAIGAVLPPRPTTIEAVCRLDTELGQAFAQAAARGVSELAGGAADLVVSHGQTVFHGASAGRVWGTLQLGQPAWITQRTGVPVLSDLRAADVAAGGQGAPLVPLFDALLLGGAPVPRAALNLGGIANVTLVMPGQPVLGYDTGPAGALLDAATRYWFGEPYDRDGRRAAAGRVHDGLLARLLADPYYAAPPPKSTGKERFHLEYLRAALPEPVPGPDDVLATLVELTARTVTGALARHGVAEVFASGGGTRNPVLMARLRDLGSWRWRSSDELGIPAGAKEAYAFALLGWASWHGLPGGLPSVTGARYAAVLGRLTAGTNRPASIKMPTTLVIADDRDECEGFV
jgi:anhydro-N-acetylmuramic acid kinase